MPQYSMTGNILDSAAPGIFGDVNDNSRRMEARRLSDLISKNPNFQRRIGQENPSAGYMSEGLAYDNEGLLGAFAAKFGQDAAMKLLEALPTMSRADLIAAQRAVQGAAIESQNQDQRERQAYERAGMEYVSGAYRPRTNGQTP